MPDEFKESLENQPEIPAETMSEKLSVTGIAAMQGNDTSVDQEMPQQDQQQGDDIQDLITVRHHPPEKLPNVETPGHSIPAEEGRIEGDEGGLPKPPPGWQPGGPERGG